VFERFDEQARQAMDMACEEADRLRHDYVGPEHVLAALARQSGSRPAGILRASGLGAEAVRSGLDRLVAQGLLPGPWRNQADLLRGLGIDLGAVQQAVETSFGAEAVRAASCRALGRSRLREDRLVCASPLTGKAMVAKRAFHRAAREADALGQRDISPEHLLLGVLRDARDPAGTGASRRGRRLGSYLGLPQGGPSPVRLIIEASGASLDALRSQLLAELPAAT
jgi:ATP-dependent Clp protease ATP-binding subunit ClpA